jgi:hypothetical protein
MARATVDFSPIDASTFEASVFGFDFSGRLATGETITSITALGCGAIDRARGVLRSQDDGLQQHKILGHL